MNKIYSASDTDKLLDFVRLQLNKKKTGLTGHDFLVYIDTALIHFPKEINQ